MVHGYSIDTFIYPIVYFQQMDYAAWILHGHSNPGSLNMEVVGILLVNSVLENLLVEPFFIAYSLERRILKSCKIHIF